LLQVSEDRLGEHARSTLGDQAGAVSSHAFAAATAFGSVETFALVRPAKVNGYAGVYVYLDEVTRGGGSAEGKAKGFLLHATAVCTTSLYDEAISHDLGGAQIGALKELPLNPRASALARACGHAASCVFYGDVFVGRVCAAPGAPMRNGDFSLRDLDSSNAWVQTAAAENYQCVVARALRVGTHAGTHVHRLGVRHPPAPLSASLSNVTVTALCAAPGTRWA
jgi:hypothetical protein